MESLAQTALSKIFTLSHLSGTQKLTLLAIANISKWTTQPTEIGLEDLAEQTTLHRDTISNAMKSLEKAGYIKIIIPRHRTGSGTWNKGTYQITPQILQR